MPILEESDDEVDVDVEVAVTLDGPGSLVPVSKAVADVPVAVAEVVAVDFALT
jgi:hypothetical protein